MRRFAILLLLFFSLPAMAARTPRAEKTAALSQKFFHRYAEKYPDSAFGQKKVSGAEVHDIVELQKNIATAAVTLKFDDSSSQNVILSLARKFPGGWRITAWEQAP